MATAAQWLEGARIRTLPAAISPVFVGSAVAYYYGGFNLVRMLLAMAVALALQVGVNFSNDYSDGIRGTDSEERVGPQRLVGSGAARPETVRNAAFICYGIAAIFGLILVWLCGQWWLILVGIAAILAAWFYTGGKHPYGYMGLGEVFVFIFFGLVATVGTTYTQLLAAPAASWVGATAIGAIACAVLVCNNLRDLPTDAVSGKMTLSVRIGDRGTRIFYALLAAIAIIGFIVMGLMTNPWMAIGAVGAAAFLIPSAVKILRGATGMSLVKVLKFTGFAELAGGLGAFIGAFL